MKNYDYIVVFDSNEEAYSTKTELYLLTAAENASRTDTGGGFCVPNLDRAALTGV